jgi:hypothetical protein
MKATLSLIAFAGLAHGEQASTSVTSNASPVSKVVTLIKDMMKELEKEQEEDEEMYDKLACWCATYDREKTKAVKDGQQAIIDLTNAIESLTGKSAQLNVEIKNLKKEIAMNVNALDQATAIRIKEKAAFHAEDKELTVAIAGIESSIDVLKKSMAPGFLQVPSEDHANLRYHLQHALKLDQDFLTHHQKKLVLSLMQEEDPTLVQTKAHAKAKAKTGNDVFGVLKAMQESFHIQLDRAVKREEEDQAAFDALKKAKEEEIDANNEQIERKTQELASSDQKLAESVEGKADTTRSLAADEEFLSNLKHKCSASDTEWEERQKTRNMEMEACSKALAVLNSDSAQQMFTKTFNPSFMQKSQLSSRRAEASKLLSGVAEKMHSPRLAAVAMKVKLDAFEKVKAAVDEMVTQLTKEQQDEIAHRDFCVKEFNTNQQETERKERNKADVFSSIDDLTQTIKTLNDQLATLKSDMSEMSTNMKRAGEDREMENVEFQKAVSEQRASIRLMNAALDILKGFYQDNEASLLQVKKQAPGAMPDDAPGFGAYKKNENSGGVMKMLGAIIADAKQMEADTIRAEEDSQKAYETMVKDTNENLGIKSEESVNLNQELAEAKRDLNQANTDKENTLLLLEQLSNRNAELHKSCDFIMDNFDIRQEARKEEINALRQAKSILSGAKFEALLQSP